MSTGDRQIRAGHKEVGAAVYAGSINAHGALRVGDPHRRRLCDHRASFTSKRRRSAHGTFIVLQHLSTPAAMVAAILVVVIPPLAFRRDWSTWIYQGLATLLRCLPCALVISTRRRSPPRSRQARGVASRQGRPPSRRSARWMVAFDKTALTLRRPEVIDVVAVERRRKTCSLRQPR